MDRDKCSARNIDPNARYHDVVEVKTVYDRVEGLVKEYACQDCGVTIRTKNHDVVVTGG